jgi:hypothetical protein
MFARNFPLYIMTRKMRFDDKEGENEGQIAIKQQHKHNQQPTHQDILST